MSVVQRIAELAKSGAISKGVQKYLTGVGSDLERLATRAANVGVRLTDDEQGQLQTLYNGYLRTAINDRMNAKNLGAIDRVRLNAEIRDDLFNKVLGGVGRTDEERLALRATLLRGPKGEGIKIADGRTVTREQYASLQTQNNIGMLSEADKILLKEIQAAEKRLDAAAMSRAAAQHHSDTATLKAKADAATAARDAQEKAAQQARKATETTSEIRRDTLQVTSRLESVYRTNGSIDADQVFSILRKHLTQDIDAPSLIPTLSRPEMKAPRDILRAINQGAPITENEFTKLQTFFYEYDASKVRNAQISPSLSPAPAMMGVNPTAAVLGFGKQLLDSATREGNSARIPKRLQIMFETGRDLTWRERLMSSVAENPLIRRGLWAAGLTTVLGVPALHLSTNVLQPQDYGPLGTTTFSIIHQNWMSPSELKHLKKENISEVTSNLYFRLTTDGGISNPMFLKFTEDMVGKNLRTKLEGLKASNENTLYVLLEVANHLPSDVVPGYNTDAIEAYKYALAKFSGMQLDDYKGNKSIADHLIDIIGKNTASRMATDIDLRNQKLQSFYGRETLSQDDLVKNFVDSKNQDPILRSSIGHYLVMQGALKLEDLTVEGLKGLKKDITEKEASLEKARATSVEAEAAKKSQETANAFAANTAATHERSPAPADGKEKKECAISPEDARNYFNTLAEGDVYQQLKGKGSALSEAYKAAAGDKALFEKTLQDRVSGLPKSVVRNVSADIFPCP